MMARTGSASLTKPANTNPTRERGRRIRENRTFVSPQVNLSEKTASLPKMAAIRMMKISSILYLLLEYYALPLDGFIIQAAAYAINGIFGGIGQANPQLREF